MHTKQCLAHALISAIENMRDDEVSDFEFRIMVQNNVALTWADTFLDSDQVGDADNLCRCLATSIARGDKFGEWNVGTKNLCVHNGVFSSSDNPDEKVYCPSCNTHVANREL